MVARRTALVALGVLSAILAAAPEPMAQTRTVRGRMQPKPGAPIEDVEVAVHEVPAQVQLGSAADVRLDDQDLVLGLLVDGQPVAYPIRYLAAFEVVNSRVGDTALAPTW